MLSSHKPPQSRSRIDRKVEPPSCIVGFEYSGSVVRGDDALLHRI
jgi:hypothetical protein